MDQKHVIFLQAQHIVALDKETHGRSIGTRDWPRRAAHRIVTYLLLRPELTQILNDLGSSEIQELQDVIEELIQQTGIRNRGYANDKQIQQELRTEPESDVRSTVQSDTKTKE
jgi:hypothetical protein